MTIDHYLTNSARIYPDKEALVCGESKFTYSTINRGMNVFAGFPLTNGIQTGERVAVSPDNGHDAVISI